MLFNHKKRMYNVEEIDITEVQKLRKIPLETLERIGGRQKLINGYELGRIAFCVPLQSKMTIINNDVLYISK